MTVDERLLEESAEELYENAPCGYLSTLPDGRIVKVNRTFLTWIGYTREELLAGVRFQDLLAAAGKIFHETHYAPLLRMQGFVNEVAFDILCKDRGKRLPVLINTSQKRDERGTPLFNRTTVFNATDRRAYERELLLARRKAEQAAKAKADLLSMISHDIRNPLTAILAATEFLQKQEGTPRQQRYVSAIRASADTLVGLTNNILEASRIEAGALILEEHPFDVRGLVNGIVQSLAARAEAKGIEVIADIDPRVPADLLGDPIKVGQILNNLASNAVKFTDGGSVTVRLRIRERQPEVISLDFAVIDTGIGIPPDRLSAIFEEFSQASYDIGLKYGGSGLGLAISRKLLELHGSRMDVHSVVGQGSVFSFNLSFRIRTGNP